MAKRHILEAEICRLNLAEGKWEIIAPFASLPELRKHSLLEDAFENVGVAGVDLQTDDQKRPYVRIGIQGPSQANIINPQSNHLDSQSTFADVAKYPSETGKVVFFLRVLVR